MVFPVNDIEMYVSLPPSSMAESTRKVLNILFSFLVILSFAHLSYGDFWGFLLDLLFALLGFITFKRLQLSTIAFFSFLCAFNTGIDLIASINLLSMLASSSSEDIEKLAESLHMQLWQIVVATTVISLDAITIGCCLILTCRVYSELRANIYSQIGLMSQPLLVQQTTQNLPPQNTQQGNGAPFVPFQGEPHRVT